MLEAMTAQPPYVVRLAAGIVAAGAEQLRRLPEQLPGLSVVAAGKGMRAWIRLQHELGELAARGDEVLANWSRPPEEAPWATFDEDVADGDAWCDEAASDETASIDEAASDEVDGDGGDMNFHGVSAGAGNAPGTDGDTGADTAGNPGPADMPGYPDLTLAQVRARMLPLTAEAVERLLAYEEETTGRASFVTLLTNRITKLRAERSSGA